MQVDARFELFAAIAASPAPTRTAFCRTESGESVSVRRPTDRAARSSDRDTRAERLGGRCGAADARLRSPQSGAERGVVDDTQPSEGAERSEARSPRAVARATGAPRDKDRRTPRVRPSVGRSQSWTEGGARVESH